MNLSSSFFQGKIIISLKCSNFPLGNTIPLGKSKYIFLWGHMEEKKYHTISAVKLRQRISAWFLWQFSVAAWAAVVSCELSSHSPCLYFPLWVNTIQHIIEKIYLGISKCFASAYCWHFLFGILLNFLFPINFWLYSNLIKLSTVETDCWTTFWPHFSCLSDETKKGN